MTNVQCQASPELKLNLITDALHFTESHQYKCYANIDELHEGVTHSSAPFQFEMPPGPLPPMPPPFPPENPPLPEHEEGASGSEEESEYESGDEEDKER